MNAFKLTEKSFSSPAVPAASPRPWRPPWSPAAPVSSLPTSLTLRAARLATQLGADKAHFVRLDVTSETDWEAAVQTCVDRFGGLDVVVNNAGIETTALFADCSLDDFNRTMNVNVSGVFLGIKHAIRAMASGRNGRAWRIHCQHVLRGWHPCRRRAGCLLHLQGCRAL